MTAQEKTMPVILHIGIGKAGSSTIQNYLTKHRDGFSASGLFYPAELLPNGKVGGDNNKCLAMACRPYHPKHKVYQQYHVCSSADHKVFYKNLCRHYREQLSKFEEGTVLLSAEHFWSELRNIEHISKLRACLQDLGLSVQRIVVYLREQVSWVESFLRQKIVEGSVVDLSNPMGGEDAMFSRLDYSSMLDDWKSVFPDAVFSVRLFARDRFVNGSLLADFFKAAGLHEPDFSNMDLSDPQNRNVSAFSAEAYLTVNLLNKVLPETAQRQLGNAGRKAVLSGLAKRVGEKSSIETLLTNEQHQRIREIFIETNKKLVVKYLNGESFDIPN